MESVEMYKGKVLQDTLISFLESTEFYQGPAAVSTRPEVG
jgi:hypothetical protein